MRYTLFRQLVTVAGLVVVATFARAADPPTIINFPTRDLDHPDDVDSDLEIPCGVTGTRPFTWTWKKFKIENWSTLEHDITSSDFEYTISSDGTLTSDRPSDGFYQCFVTNSVGTTFSRKIRVKISTARKFQDHNDVTVDVTLGQSKTIKCPPRGESFGGSYQWGKKDPDLNTYRRLGDQKHRIVTAEGDLIFSYVKQEDLDDAKELEGLQCRIEAGGTVRYSHTITLNKVGNAYTGTTPASFAASLSGPYKATEGEDFVLHCAAIGKPTPDISWLKDGKPIVYGTDSFEQGVRSLKIEKVDKKTHEGQYECKATSSASPAPITSSARLDVQVGSKIISYPGTNTSVGYNETLVVGCNASGVPQPQLSWWMNGKQLQGGGRITVSPGAVSIREVSLADMGVYQCVAKNLVGMDVSMTYVQVMGKPPKFQTVSVATKVLQGSDATLYCNPQGGPPTNITWIKDDKTIDINQPNSRFSIDSSNSLLIKETQQSDEVPFTCKAVNGYGEATLTWNVDILDKAEITTEPLDITVIQGETAEFNCKAKADAGLTLQYKWLKDGENIKYNQQITWDEQKGVLKIRNVQIQNTGSFTCVSHTPVPYYSRDSATAVLRIKGVPDSPQNLQVSNCSDSKAILTWVLGNAANLTITHLVVEQESNYNKGVFHSIENVTDPRATSTKLELTPYANLTFRMTAFSYGVASRPSEPTKAGTCETKPAKPMKYPDNLRGVPGGAGNLTIRWDALSRLEQNGPGFFYNIQLKKKSAAVWMSAVTHPPHNYYHVKNAGVLVEWEFKVWGQNHVGTGPHSPVVTAFSGQDFPPKIQGLQLTGITKSSVHLTWSAAEMTSGRIDGYRIHYRPTATRRTTRTNLKGDGKKLTLNNDACTNTTCFAKITGLDAGASYEVVVTAFNSRGEGPASEARTFETLDVPKTPIGLEGITDGARMLKITWKALQKHEVKATWRYYVLRWKRVTDKSWKVVNITDQSNTSYRVEDAGCNIPWTFQIWAVNGIGSSSLSNTVEKSSGPCPPSSKPENLKIIRVTTNSVDLEWGALTNESVDGYNVHYISISNKTLVRRDNTKKAWQTQQHKASAVCDSKKCRVAVAGLKAETSYRMYVSAYNGGGEGPRSEEIVIDTAAPREQARELSPEPWWKKAWFIILIVFLILLVILLIVCIVCCCKRRREKERGKGSYDVVKTSEKEAKKNTAV